VRSNAQTQPRKPKTKLYRENVNIITKHLRKEGKKFTKEIPGKKEGTQRSQGGVAKKENVSQRWSKQHGSGAH